MRHSFLFTALTIFALSAIGGEEAPLDPRPRLAPPVMDLPLFNAFRFDVPERAAELELVISHQSPVKSQVRRGTCSIFATTAHLESLIKIRDQKEWDLSENYMEFLVQAKVKSFPSEGSDTDKNVPAIQGWGDIDEATWPYEPNDWAKVDDLSTDEAARRQAMCGSLSGSDLKICTLSHLNPHQNPYEDSAAQLRRDLRLNTLNFNWVSGVTQIRNLLSRGYPVTLSVEFFYGAWNHRKMVEYGIGERDMDAWERGVVSTPTSNDVRLSRKHPAGHSFVVVGYSDEEQVYYFKNSWGKDSFGVKSDLLGAASTPGYGRISYGYAHQFGTFYQVNLR